MPIINGINYKPFDIPDPDNLIEVRNWCKAGNGKL